MTSTTPEPGAADETTPEAEVTTPAPAAARRTGRPTLVLAGLAVLTVAAVALAGVLGFRLLEQRQAEQRRADVLAAATQVAVNFTTLDHTTFDADTARVLAGATGTFAEEFSGQVAQLRGVVTQNKAVSTGKVLQAGLVSIDEDSARVLVAVDADVTNTSLKTPAARHYRLQLDMARVGDRWKAGQLQFVG